MTESGTAGPDREAEVEGETESRGTSSKALAASGDEGSVAGVLTVK